MAMTAIVNLINNSQILIARHTPSTSPDRHARPQFTEGTSARCSQLIYFRVINPNNTDLHASGVCPLLDMDIDKLLPFKSYSLEQFIRTASAIRSNEDDPNCLSSFERFVLTGRHDTEHHQVALDTIRDRIPNELPVQVNRDYSLIGISHDIRLSDTPLFVSPVARTDQTLTSNVHLTLNIGEVCLRCSLAIRPTNHSPYFL
jgi:hypothetical protein